MGTTSLPRNKKENLPETDLTIEKCVPSLSRNYKVRDIFGDSVASGTRVFACLFLASSRPAWAELDKNTLLKEKRPTISKALSLMQGSSPSCALADFPSPGQASIMCPGQSYSGVLHCDRYLSNNSVMDQPFVMAPSFGDLGPRLAGSIAVGLKRDRMSLQQECVAEAASQGSQSAESSREV